MASPQKKIDPLGRLKSFGLSEPWQVALLLPTGWDDMTRLVEQFDPTAVPLGNCVVIGTLSGNVKTSFSGGSPRTYGRLVDPVGRQLGFSLFGDTREFQKKLYANKERVVMYGEMELYKNECQLRNPAIINERWIGKLRPRYPGKPSVIGPDLVRARVLSLLKESIPTAADFLSKELGEFGERSRLVEIAGLPRWAIGQMIYQAHLPHSLEYGQKATKGLERLASLGIIKAAQSNRGTPSRDGAVQTRDWRKRSASIPFSLTDEQEQAICDAINGLGDPAPMRHLLSGDVGTGKTAVYGTVAAAVIDAGGTVVILLPNESLAGQVAREFTSWWPDINLQLVTGNTQVAEVTAPLVVGTTAILFRNVAAPSLMIVDEQQKMSREQREQLVGPATNLLEVTATCIPRTQALVRYGVVKVSRLTKCHTEKYIHTKIWHRNEWPKVATGIKETIAAGDQVLYVYPLREQSDKETGEPDPENKQKNKRPELNNATDVYEKWQKVAPGRVRLIHGQMSGDEKAAALDDMVAGRASVLIATTVVEVGINLPKLRRVVIVHPERHGLSALHQIRGRAARLGGDGWCDLFLPNPIKDDTLERLQVLEKTQNGFEVAEHDMRLRGIGDLSSGSDKQSGSDGTFLYGRPVSIDILDEVIALIGDGV